MREGINRLTEEEKMLLYQSATEKSGGPDGVEEETEGQGNHESWHLGYTNGLCLEIQPSSKVQQWVLLLRKDGVRLSLRSRQQGVN